MLSVGMHVGRGLAPDKRIEQLCSCPKEPCGLVDEDKADQQCQQHQPHQTMRQLHAPEECPGVS